MRESARTLDSVAERGEVRDGRRRAAGAAGGSSCSRVTSASVRDSSDRRGREEECTVQRGVADRALARRDGRRARLSRRSRRLGARACGGRLRRHLRGRLGDGLGRSNGRGDGRGGLGRRRLAALHLDALAVELVGRDARPAVDAGRRALEAAPAALSPGLSGRGRPTVEASRVGVTGLDERGRDKAEGDEVGEEAHAERRKGVAARPAGRWR